MKKVIIIAVAAVVVLIAVFIAVFIFFLRGDSGPKEVVLTSYSPGEYFVTNVKDSKKLLKVSVVLGVADAKIVEEFKEKNHIIRDAVIFILRDLTEEKFNSQDVNQQLSGEIRDKLNETLKTDSIHEVWFEDFVMQ